MKRVLVVEDNEDSMKVITFILEKSGYSTIRAETGEKGVELVLKEKPDFIILDIQLPGIDGFEVMKKIRNSVIGDRVPIIAMTSFAMIGDMQMMLNAGFHGYIEKPIDPERVIGQIQKIVGE